MMSGKNLLRAVIGIFIGGALLTMTITYQVQFTDSAVVETLGKPTGEPMGAGLHPRWPWPIQRVITYDMRVQHFEGVYEQMQTKDGKNVLVSVFVCWRVADPLLFRQAVSDKLSEGETFIQQKVRDATLQVVGNYPMDAFASRQEGAVKLKEMEKRILEQTRPLAISQYGVDVLRVGIKRLSLPEDVTTVVMENMRSERQQKAEDARSQGEAAANAIISEANSIADQVLSFALLKAEQIKAQGSAEAAEYYKRFGEDEGFAMFLRRLNYLRETLTEGTVFLNGSEYDESHEWFNKAPTPEGLGSRRPKATVENQENVTGGKDNDEKVNGE